MSETGTSTLLEAKTEIDLSYPLNFSTAPYSTVPAIQRSRRERVQYIPWPVPRSILPSDEPAPPKKVLATHSQRYPTSARCNRPSEEKRLLLKHKKKKQSGKQKTETKRKSEKKLRRPENEIESQRIKSEGQKVRQKVGG